MSVNYFNTRGSQSRRFEAIACSSVGKMLRVKQSKDNQRRPAIIMIADVPVTSAMLKGLPKKAQAFFSKEDEEDAGAGSALPLQQTWDWSVGAVLKFFGPDNFNKKARPKAVKGHDNEDRATLKVEKLFFDAEGKPMMKIKMICWKDSALWDFCGTILESPRFTLDVRALQAELPFDGEKEDDGDAPKDGEAEDDGAPEDEGTEDSGDEK